MTLYTRRQIPYMQFFLIEIQDKDGHEVRDAEREKRTKVFLPLFIHLHWRRAKVLSSRPIECCNNCCIQGAIKLWAGRESCVGRS